MSFNMEYIELIHKYLDEGLNDVNQKTLFDKLAVDDSLREEFNQQIALQKLTLNNNSSFAPPVDVTNNIFSGLGFSIPNQAAVTAKSSRRPGAAFWGTIGGVGAFNVIKSNLSTLLSIALATILTTLLFIFFGNKFPGNNTGQVSTASLINSTNIIEPVSKSENDIILSSSRNIENYNQARNSNIVSSIAIDSEKVESNTKTEQQESNLISYNDNFSELLISEVKEELFSPEKKETFNNMINLQNNNLYFDHYGIKRTRNQINPNTLFYEQHTELNGFGIELRARNGINNFNTDVSILNNFELGLSFELDDNNFILAYAGVESFDRVQSRALEGEEVYESGVSPVTKFSVAYRHNANYLSLFEIVSPYIQLGSGPATSGWNSRAEIGLIFKPETRMSLLVGYGATYYNYNFENNWFNQINRSFDIGFRYNL